MTKVSAGWSNICGECAHYAACEYDERIGICDLCFVDDDAPWWTKRNERAIDSLCEGIDFEETR